jgi:SPP1 gp7 family putative phage head morphogenesis protein
VVRPTLPKGAQLYYYQLLLDALSYAHALVKARVLPRLEADASPATINRVMDQVSEAFFRQWSTERMTKAIRKYAERISTHQREQLARQLGIDPSQVDKRRPAHLRTDALAPIPKGTGIESAVRQFTAENVALIKSLPQSAFDKVEQRVLGGMANGLRHEEIAQQLQETFEISRGRAALIARDQTSKFNGRLNQLRQENLGIDQYVWHTAGDERVRSEHAERNLQVYRWSDPPGDPEDPAAGGHPGQAINCRCFATPVLDLGEDDTEDAELDENA